MTDEQKWILLFGRGWIDWVDLENNATVEVKNLCVRLQQDLKLVYAIGSNRIKLKEADE
jgi:hypothetical protein